MLRIGGALAAAGFLAVALIPWPLASLAGFVIVGIGASNIVPVLFSGAGRVPGVPPGIAPGDGHDDCLRRPAARPGADRLHRRRDQPVAGVRAGRRMFAVVAASAARSASATVPVTCNVTHRARGCQARRASIPGVRERGATRASGIASHVSAWHCTTRCTRPALHITSATPREGQPLSRRIANDVPSSPRIRSVVPSLLASSVNSTLGCAQSKKRAGRSTEWPTYGHDPGGKRFSPLTQLTPANVGQLEVAWVYHMRPDAAPRHAHPPPTRRRPGRGRGRGIRLRGQRDDAARDRRRDVHHQSVRPRRRARLDDRQGGVGVPGAVRRAVDAWRRVLGRRREDARRRSSSARATAACSRSTRRPASRTTRSATTASINLNTPEILRGLPGTTG